MACPLRVVLVAASLLLAWLAWWRASAEETEAARGALAAGAGGGADAPSGPGALPNQKQQQQEPWSARALSSARVLIDMASGRYLYRAWQESRRGPLAEDERAASAAATTANAAASAAVRRRKAPPAPTKR